MVVEHVDLDAPDFGQIIREGMNLISSMGKIRNIAQEIYEQRNRNKEQNTPQTKNNRSARRCNHAGRQWLLYAGLHVDDIFLQTNDPETMPEEEYG